MENSVDFVIAFFFVFIEQINLILLFQSLSIINKIHL